MSERRLIDGHPFVPHARSPLSVEDGTAAGRALIERLKARRTVRAFSPDPVPREMIELAITAGGTAPSGAHQQPWTWVAVSDPAMKRKIRQAAEAEEARNYGGRMPEAWQRELAPLGTDAHKPYLEIAPWLVVLFVQTYSTFDDGSRRKHYYPRESCGIAAGMFLAAVHEMGLASLTHTPSPMKFLGDLLGRPSNEQAFLLMPVGYPADECWVPDIERKGLPNTAVWVEAP